jgi:hypothetical protein
MLKASNFHLFDDFCFQNGGKIKDGVFQDFYAFLQLILNY